MMLRPSSVNQWAFQSALDAYIQSLTGLVAFFPLDDEPGSLARVINPALALGRELVINGTFATDTIWSKGAGWTIAAGFGVATAVANGLSIFQALPIVVGKSYEVTYTVSGFVAGGVRAQVGSTGFGITRTADGTYTETIVCAGTANFGLQAVGVTTLSIDDVSCKQVNLPASASFTGAQLLLNPNFDTDAVWAKGTNWTINNGAAHAAAVGSGFSIQQPTPMVIGRRYRSRFNLLNYVAGSVQALFGGTGGLGAVSSNGLDDKLSITGSATYLIGGVTTFTGDIDNASLIEIPPMSGYNGNGVAANKATQGINAGIYLREAYSFDGTNDFVNIYSPDLNSAFNPAAGTLFVFAKVLNAAVWADAIVRRFIQIRADANNLIILDKTGTANQVRIIIIAGGVTSQVLFTISSLDFFEIAITWDVAADEMKAYVNGLQVGVTQTGLGAWVGNFSTTENLIGALNSSGGNSMRGQLSKAAIYNRALTAAEILQIARLGGVA